MSSSPKPSGAPADTPPDEARSPRILIIADDLTGGNSCGALFAEAGLRTMTLTGTGGAESPGLGDVLDDYDAVVVNAESRHLPAETAADITSAIVAAAGPVDLATCRIDTTLRGNVGVTAEAALASRQAQAGDGVKVIGLCVPAFPTAGRTTVGGRQLLDGRLLEDTELRHDVRSPMETSVVADILATGTELTTAGIELETVLDGRPALRAAMLRAVGSGVDVIVCDALTTEHVDLIGRVAADLTREIASTPADAPGDSARLAANLRHGESLEWLAIDPGPGSLSLARALLPARTDEVILGISGSATEVTRAQLAELGEDPTITVLRAVLDDEGLPAVDATVEKVMAVASARAIIVATVIDASDIGDLTPEQSELLPRRLARIAAEVMDRRAVSGLYTTGGDITAAVLGELDALGMELDTQIIPLAVGGRLIGGAHSGVPIVTKGGLIGDSATAALCLDYLSQSARQRTAAGRAAGET
ncbi:uncharacterized protein YgbK (DUF1537 family) [Brevibacterium sanguinis]|uniref:Uncharacterized protein YgbK (DUF1537 family) n=2 Tax=Brevibacterium TaxID=1696 RepID=A0A366IFX7_9MICO|nr:MULTISPECIES: four-carbon acid sugar kinase family protein [Brevibacterium]RBP63587.1 uncharacterized protein YgbK (DUF1537 family) [Brevibacterium sanguinis]RBP70246.1 uncharacterized protein YgbK (DUF1537 family) [Brevibacterium celere]